jgi:hypothetical protein
MLDDVCEVQVDYSFGGRFDAPLFLIVDPSRVHDVPVDPDSLSSSCAPLALSSEDPCRARPRRPPTRQHPLRRLKKSREFG